MDKMYYNDSNNCAHGAKEKYFKEVYFMKMSKILSLVLAALMLVACLASCGGDDESSAASTGSQADTSKSDASTGEQSQAASAELAGTYDITLWVSEIAGVKDLTQKQINAFMTANPGIKINATIEGVPEGDAASKVVADVATAPDIYCFAQDQLARLVQAAALAAPGRGAAANIIAANDEGSVKAATVAGTLQAYPLTSDNGYYMYYDTSIISAEDAGSMEKLIAACEQNNLKFRYALENAWYTASFFFGAGCVSEWTMDAEGNFNAVNDTFNSDAGLVAMKGMMKLAQSTAYDSDADNFVDAGVIITGIWNAENAATHFGDKLGVAKLPSFEVDGKSYQLGSFSGYKLMGVKPQTDAKKGAVLSLLAQYLTGKDCQLERYNEFQWGPSNKEAQADEKVKANASLIALNAQNQFAVPQGQIHGSWWDIAKVLGADAKAAKSEDDLKAALEAYKKSVDDLFKMTDEEKQAWAVIGNICNTNWDTDLPMTKTSDTTWESEVLELKAGQEYKVRQGASWDVNFGAEGFNSATNCVVEADGKYIVKLTWDGAQTGTVELVAAE